MTSLNAVPDSDWAKLASRRIFFGHQSVGGNVMDGVAELVREQPRLAVRVAAGESALAAGGGVFAHELLGRNGQPEAKTDDFARLLEGGLGARVDVAFHKYCYADIFDTTDVARVFAHYEQTMARLHAEYPSVVFERFNDFMRRAYAGREPLFDLAALESTRPDGTRESIHFRGSSSYALVPAYSSDGSHLNETGRRWVAESLLVFLARLGPSH